MAATYKHIKKNGEVGRTVTIGDDNLIWVARGIVGEGGLTVSKDTASAMLWAMVNRMLLSNITWCSAFGCSEEEEANDRELEYWEMWRAFSQPINPRWDGIVGNEYGSKKDKCRPGGLYYGTKFCSDAVLERRETMRELTWEDIPQGVKTWIREFQYGLLFPPDAFATETTKSRISNWSAAWLKQNVGTKEAPVMKPITEVFPWGLKLGGEWFFEDPWLVGGHVEVDSDPGGHSILMPLEGGWITPLALAGILGLSGYLLYRYISG